jgi:hypothetical protein
MKTLRPLLALIIAFQAVSPAFAQSSICVVSGTVIDLHGQPARKGTKIKLTPVAANGIDVLAESSNVTVRDNGAIIFDAVRGIHLRIEGPVLRYDKLGGLVVQIPNTATANFNTLPANVVIADITGTFAWDPPPLANGETASRDFTFVGVVAGNVIAASFTVVLPAGVYMAMPQVIGPDLVRVTIVNASGSSQDITQGTIKAVRMAN